MNKEIERIEGELVRLKILKKASKRARRRFANTFAKAVTYASAIWEREKKLNGLSKGEPCEMLTGSGRELTISELASCVPTMEDNFRDVPEWLRSYAPVTFKKD